MVLMLAVFSSNALAYGSSSSKKACKKHKFTNFTPVHLSVVAPQSDFSFWASALSNPETIVVSVKKQTVDVEIKKANGGYSVTGKIPSSLQSTHARIDIKATGTNNCKANDGWLLKIEGL
jgi:hypothetical protein